MALFILTDCDGFERSFNTETLVAITTFDLKTRSQELHDRLTPWRDKSAPLPEEQQAKYDRITAAWKNVRSEVHTVSDSWAYVRETVRDAARIANEAIAQAVPSAVLQATQPKSANDLKDKFSLG